MLTGFLTMAGLEPQHCLTSNISVTLSNHIAASLSSLGGLPSSHVTHMQPSPQPRSVRNPQGLLSFPLCTGFRLSSVCIFRLFLRSWTPTSVSSAKHHYREFQQPVLWLGNVSQANTWISPGTHLVSVPSFMEHSLTPPVVYHWKTCHICLVQFHGCWWPETCLVPGTLS